MKRLLRPLWYLLAALFLLEAWLWGHLLPVVRRVLARLPFEALRARVAHAIEHLPPSASLLVFGIPVVGLQPFKLVALWWIARGHVTSGTLTLVFIETFGVALTAFLFEACKPKLMQIRWFVVLYQRVLDLKVRAHVLLAPALAEIRALGARLRGHRSRVLALILRLRRRILARG